MNSIIAEEKIHQILADTTNPSPKIIEGILEKARKKKGISLKEVGYLVNIRTSVLTEPLFETAAWIKNEIYGERLVFFAPLYISNFCVNDCVYCNFHRRNRSFSRQKLSLSEIEKQTEFLIEMGHKRLLLEFGEDPVENNIDYIVSTIEKIYAVKTPRGNIRRVNVNIAATSEENYRQLKKAHIGTYQLFQETYHRKTYEQVHSGPKADYERQITAFDRAFKAGLDDVGLGVLFGLYDWRFEVVSLVAHAQYLDQKYGVGPHTFSVPRFRPAPDVNFKPAYSVNDFDFLKIIAILRIAVPYTGIIISTRERPEIRKKGFKIGISQTSAGSITEVGGYGKKRGNCQFTLSDERSLEKVIETAVEENLIPSFCTACYRLQRTGEEFMSLAKNSKIHLYCSPNALLTFAEYLEDFISKKNGLYQKGYQVINYYLNKIENKSRRLEVLNKLNKIKQKQRDLYF
jgi:2-iminoacetate synthase